MKTWIAIALLAVGLCGCASNNEVAQNEDGLICRMVRPTGSNIPTRICHTQEEVAEQEKQGQKLIRDLSSK